jgi:A/G-specific adenine glycosylase
MLQQTTVVAVVPYFERFVAKYPNVRSLAAANIDDVLRLWEGLGYYSRARNLHKAALVIEQDHGGVFPNHAETLQTLPGVGRYTAGAIASFAFDQPAPIVEANTERLYARLTGLSDDVRSSAGQRALWDYAAEIMPRRRPGDFNQALMDIGSQICRPNQPNCPKCPLKTCCEAFASGRQNELPVRRPRVPITAVDEICVVIRRRNKYLLRRREDGERWAGMWDFVRFELDATEVDRLPVVPSPSQTKKKVAPVCNLFRSVYNDLPDTVQKRIHEQVGAKVGDVVAALEFTYSVTRYRVRLRSFLCDSTVPESVQGTDTSWFSASELAGLPLSKTGRRVADWLTSVSKR